VGILCERLSSFCLRILHILHGGVCFVFFMGNLPARISMSKALYSSWETFLSRLYIFCGSARHLKIMVMYSTWKVNWVSMWSTFFILVTHSTYSIWWCLRILHIPLWWLCIALKRAELFYEYTDVGYVFYMGHLLQYSMSKATLFFMGNLFARTINSLWKPSEL